MTTDNTYLDVCDDFEPHGRNATLSSKWRGFDHGYVLLEWKCHCILFFSALIATNLENSSSFYKQVQNILADSLDVSL